MERRRNSEKNCKFGIIIRSIFKNFEMLANDKRFNDYLWCFSLEKWGRMGNVASTSVLDPVPKTHAAMLFADLNDPKELGAARAFHTQRLPSSQPNSHSSHTRPTFVAMKFQRGRQNLIDVHYYFLFTSGLKMLMFITKC